MSTTTLYRVAFQNQGKVYEVYAEQVRSSDVFGFVELSGLTFDTRESVVVDPSEEALRTEFSGVRATLVPMHAVVRIDEVERRGSARITDAAEAGSKITPFPIPAPRPDRA